MENEKDPKVDLAPEKKKLYQKRYFPLFVLGLIFLILSVSLVLLWSERNRAQLENKRPETVAISEIVPGQLIVKFKKGTSDETINEDLKKYNSRIKSRIEGIGSVIIEVPRGQERAIAGELSKDPLVEYSEPDYIQKINFIPNDPSFNLQWALTNSGQTLGGKKCTQNADIGASLAWDVTRGEGVKVAVLDTGINLAHPDLASKVVAQKIFNTSSIEDNYGHGTHVAGIIAAIGNNSQGVSGICPGCQLIIGKCMDDSGKGPTSLIASSITWAADNGAKVINISAGGVDISLSEQSAINYAWEKGAIVVAASGNENTSANFYPAAFPKVLSVSATDCTDKKASFTNYGAWVKVAAPGENIYSTLPIHAFNMQQEKPGLKTNYGYLSGTSMASPLASGLAALLWSTSAGTSPQAVVQRITDTADKIVGTGQYWSVGRINAGKAVGQLVSPTPVPTSILSSTPFPTSVPSPTPPIQVTPTWFCAGGMNCVPSVSPAVTSVVVAPTEIPIVTDIVLQPTASDQQPSAFPSNTALEEASSKPKNLLQILLGFIALLINFFLSIFR